MKLLPIIVSILLSSNLIAQKSDTPRQLQEGVYLKDGGIIDSMHTRCVLVSIKRTTWGNKHLFVNDGGDTLYTYYQIRLKKDSCYKIPTMDLKKFSVN